MKESLTRARFAPLVALALVAVLAGPVAATSEGPKANCREPRDFGEQSYCFLAQFHCLGAYFGIDGKPDYPKALRCFEANKLWDFVALMYINGEGAPRDLQKAAEALKNWQQQTPDDFNREQAAILQRAINSCKRHPELCPRVDYCKQLEETTQEIEICGAVDELSEETLFTRAIAATRSELGSADRALLDRAVTEFKGYQMYDMQRQYQASIDASLRDVAGAGQAAFVRENFLKLMASTIRSRNLKPATVRSYTMRQSQLDRELARNLSEAIQFWKEGLEDPRAKELWDEYRSEIEDYKKWARQSQLQRIKFRDACAELAASLYRDHAREFDPAVSMKATVTKLRIAELRYDPIGPSPN